MDLPENEAVFGYLYVEQLPSWRTSKSIWIVDGYSLSTHPDLCERVQAIMARLGTPYYTRIDAPATPDQKARLLKLSPGALAGAALAGEPIVAALAAEDCDAELFAPPREPDSRFRVIAQKQRELDALTAAGWTRLDPYTVNVPKDEGLARLADHVARAVAAAISHSSE